ncbi:hypothetical protein CR513_09236, partial [Mucuna pruriens]
MAAHTQDDKLLIHFFQESLARVAYGWYLNLEKGQIKMWADLVEAFLQQYRYNEELALDRTQLQIWQSIRDFQRISNFLAKDSLYHLGTLQLPSSLISAPYPTGSGLQSPSTSMTVSKNSGQNSQPNDAPKRNPRSLKHKVQDLVDAGWLHFQEANPNINNNPLPKHGNPTIGAILTS